MGKLVASSNYQRYAIDNPDGPDLTSGIAIEIWLNGMWIPGHVEHHHNRHGYYFIADTDGSICGLCLDMIARIPGTEA